MKKLTTLSAVAASLFMLSGCAVYPEGTIVQTPAPTYYYAPAPRYYYAPSPVYIAPPPPRYYYYRPLPRYNWYNGGYNRY